MKKRILLLSDTHADEYWTDLALAQAKNVDMIFHLGDHTHDAQRIARKTGLPVVGVKGNCDGGDFPLTEEVIVCGQKFFLTHGHAYGVKMSLNRLVYAAEEREADAALFGHTHRGLLTFSGRILVMNPGSVSLPRSGVHTFGILEVSPNGIVPELVAVKKE